jgi:hypothetical protein
VLSSSERGGPPPPSAAARCKIPAGKRPLGCQRQSQPVGVRDAVYSGNRSPAPPAGCAQDETENFPSRHAPRNGRGAGAARDWRPTTPSVGLVAGWGRDFGNTEREVGESESFLKPLSLKCRVNLLAFHPPPGVRRAPKWRTGSRGGPEN